MEAIATLSLASNVLQVVEAGCKTVSTLKQAYKTGTTEGNETLTLAAQNLSYTTTILQKSIELPATQHESRLWDFAQNCAEAATELEQKVVPFSVARGRRWDKLKQGFQTIKNKSNVDKLAARITSYREILNTEILVDIRSRFDVASLLQQNAFLNLDVSLQDFIRQQAGLQIEEHEKTRQVVLDESKGIAAELRALQLSNDEKSQYDKLVFSLTFPNMNARKNQIRPAHFKTCEWIFQELRDTETIGNSVIDGNGESDNDTVLQNRSGESGADGVLKHSNSSPSHSIDPLGGVEEGDKGENTHQDGTEDGFENVRSGRDEAVGSGKGDTDETKNVDHRIREGVPQSGEPIEGKIPSSSDAYSDDKKHNFAHWLRMGDGMYWISGKAGSGKSTMMNFISNHDLTRDHLRQWAATQETFILEAYLWNAGSEEQRSVRGLAASLMVQILQKFSHLGKLLLSHRPRTQLKASYSDWSYVELQNCLTFLVREMATKSCIFIDGLDEAQITRFEPQETLFQLIQTLSSVRSVKCCVSSRPVKYFEDVFQGRPRLCMQDQNANDINQIFHDVLRPIFCTQFTLNDDEIQRLETNFRAKAQGVFLWAHLAVESLKRGLSSPHSFEELQTRLNSLPSELEDMYEGMWKQNNPDMALFREQAAWFFKIALLDNSRFGDLSVLHCTLAVPQNQHLRDAAVRGQIHSQLLEACYTTQANIQTRCAGMLEIINVNSGRVLQNQSCLDQEVALDNIKKSQIQFIHRTARDYLLNTCFGQQLTSHVNLTESEVIRSSLRAHLCESSISSRLLYLEELREVIFGIQDWREKITRSTRIELLQMAENAYRTNFSKHLDLSEPGKWYIYARDRDFEERQPLVFGTPPDSPLDFLGLTINCAVADLMESYIENGAKLTNPAYARYCLAYWKYYGKSASIMEDGEGIWKTNLNLFDTLLSHTALDVEQTIVKPSLLFPRGEKFSAGISLPGHLYTEMWHWTLSLADDEHEAFGLFCRTVLALKFDLDSKVLLQARMTEQRLLVLELISESPSGDDDLDVLVVECNISFLLTCIFSYHKIDCDCDLASEMLAKLMTSKIEPSLECLLVCGQLEFWNNFGFKVKESDSANLKGCLLDAISRYPFGVSKSYGAVASISMEPAMYEVLKKEMAAVWKRGEEVDTIEYLKELGWMKDADDPEVMNHPPPLYLDDDEVSMERAASGKEHGSVGVQSPIGNFSESEDEFFDAAEHQAL